MIRVFVAWSILWLGPSLVLAQDPADVPEAPPQEAHPDDVGEVELGAEADVDSTEGVEQPNSVDSAADEEARIRFNAGSEHYAQGEFAAAAENFQAAYDLSGRPELLHNVYLAHRDAGNVRGAADSLRVYLRDADSVEERPLLESRLRALEAQLEPQDPPPDQAPPPPAEPGSSLVLPGALVLGLGSLTLVGSLVTGLLATSADADVEALCPAPDFRCSTEDARTEFDRAETLATVTNVLLIAGGSLVAVGATLLVIGVADSGEPESLAFGCGPLGCQFRGGF